MPGLNKGEARNALARAVFFNRLGEIRDRSFEQQRYRASGLNLVTAAIVLWNTLGRISRQWSMNSASVGLFKVAPSVGCCVGGPTHILTKLRPLAR